MERDLLTRVVLWWSSIPQLRATHRGARPERAGEDGLLLHHRPLGRPGGGGEPLLRTVVDRGLSEVREAVRAGGGFAELEGAGSGAGGPDGLLVVLGGVVVVRADEGDGAHPEDFSMVSPEEPSIVRGCVGSASAGSSLGTSFREVVFGGGHGRNPGPTGRGGGGSWVTQQSGASLGSREPQEITSRAYSKTGYAGLKVPQTRRETTGPYTGLSLSPSRMDGPCRSLYFRGHGKSTTDGTDSVRRTGCPRTSQISGPRSTGSTIGPREYWRTSLDARDPPRTCADGVVPSCKLSYAKSAVASPRPFQHE